MKTKAIRAFLGLFLALTLLATPVAADSFTFTTPGTDGAADAKSEAVQKIEAMIDAIESDYYKDVTEEELLNGALKGMFEALDQHSVYFSPEEYDSFMTDITGEIVGIGVTIEKRDDGITVVAPIEGSPAFKAGLKTGDKLVSVDGKDISGYTVEQAGNIIRGQLGTKVRIGVRREGIKDPLDFEFVRENIKINPVKYEIKDDGIGYLRITEFNQNTSENVEKAVEAFKAKGVKGIIIDLRGNPGGLLDEVADVCRQLVPKGPIVKIETKGQIIETFDSDLEAAPFKAVVLVNGGSASASEIMAGAIKDSGVGILVGEKTYGKGTVQHTSKLSDGGGYKITIANYLTRSGFSLDGIGLKPDVEVAPNKYTDILKEMAPIKGDRTMKSGIIGLDVLGLQQRLQTMGYDIKKTDGVFGKGTAAAVLAFQKANKLKEDGDMDAADVKALEAKFVEIISAPDPQYDRAMVEIKKMLGMK